MKKQKFSGIIALMSLSLLGIILIQVFWMKQAISVKEEQLDQQINEALHRAAFRIERNQNAYFLSSMFSSMQTGMNYPLQQSTNSTTDDSIISAFGDYWNPTPAQGKITINCNDKQVQVKHEIKDGMEQTIYGFDTVIVQGNSTQRIKTWSSITSPAQTKKTNQYSNTELVKAGNMKQQLNNIMDQMLLEFSIRDIPLNERLGQSVIEPTLAFELHNLNIPLKYEYAITDQNGTPYPNMATQGFKRNKLKQAYKTQLFPNDIMARADQLMVVFPEKRSFIYGSLIWLFAGSVIFTLIIILTFLYTLRTILNQKKLSEMKTDFINNMTHEFKTPIATISLATDAISNPEIIHNPDKISRFTQIIKEENRRMNRQVESVLQMSLLDKKDFNLMIKETYVHPLIEQAVKNISLQVEQKGGVIHKQLEAPIDLVKVDETHFINIIYNLLDNANKYALDAAPEITISTHSVQGIFYISVSDNGIGMDKETQDRVFEKFYRYSTGNVHTVKGFGLGLSYVKAIVLAFKGDITIKSELGKGSTFTIKLPH